MAGFDCTCTTKMRLETTSNIVGCYLQKPLNLSININSNCVFDYTRHSIHTALLVQPFAIMKAYFIFACEQAVLSRMEPVKAVLTG